MLNPNRTIHHTTVQQIDGAAGEGWEFHCNECNFRMRYYLLECSPETQLEVVSLGDANARHLSAAANLLSGRGEFIEEEDWLTPEIRQTIEAILKKLDD